MGSPTSHGGQIITGKPRVLLGVATFTAPVVDFAKAGALNSQGHLTPEAEQALNKDPFGFVEWAKAKGALVDEGLTAQAAGAISEEACSAEISQLMEGSYLNAATNVAKLRDLYQLFSTDTVTAENHRIRVYVSGVGTKSGKEDDAWAMGTGMGERGILTKIMLGCQNLADEIYKGAGTRIDNLVLDIFGFSRGTATARHFVNEVQDGVGGALGQAFQEQGIAWPKNVTIRFLGLFDTVAAVVDVRSGDFSLNSLREPGGRLPGHFDEWVLPGAHSDIGGGYPENFHEHIQIVQPRKFLGHHPKESYEHARVLMERRQMINQGWLGPNNPEATLTVEEAYRRRLKEGEVELQFQLWLDRRVQTEYSRVALRQMYRLAKDAGMPFDTLNPALEKYALLDELQPIATQITHHINEDQPLQLSIQEEALLRQRYIHHSAHYQTAGPLFPFKPAPGSVRRVYPNRGLA